MAGKCRECRRKRGHKMDCLTGLHEQYFSASGNAKKLKRACECERLGHDVTIAPTLDGRRVFMWCRDCHK